MPKFTPQPQASGLGKMKTTSGFGTRYKIIKKMLMIKKKTNHHLHFHSFLILRTQKISGESAFVKVLGPISRQVFILDGDIDISN